MSKDLRDPKKLGERMLYWAKVKGCRVSAVPAAFVKVPDYAANPTTIEKYGRPQDLPPTPF